jgi:lysine-specific demethylase/histidyl-hydroxylase NO66
VRVRSQFNFETQTQDQTGLSPSATHVFEEIRITFLTMMKQAPPAAAAVPPANNNGGMSRAAKKRAKKKKQKHHQQQQPPPDDEPDYNSDDDDDVVVTKKLKTSKGEDAAVAPANAKTKQDSDEDEGIIPDEPNDAVDAIVEGLVSKLTLSQILMQQEVAEGEAMTKVVGSDGAEEEVDLRELLQEVTAKQRAKCLFQSMLGPTVTCKEFYEEYFEKKPLLIQQHGKSGDDKKNSKRFDGFLSKASIQELTETQPMAYGRDLNVTRYEQGADGVKRRITLDQVGETDGDFVVADANDLWSNYNGSGCTIRLLCPHQHSDEVHALLSSMELEWGCMVGSNAYLTPPGASQGFSPHYDDICAYILQLEGKKHWKVYAPLNKQETLPRTSSSDYTEEDLKGIEPVLDVVLEPGDLLYMPRGWIHQACTLPTREHSLHLTASAMQQWAWIDYLEMLIPEALAAAADSAKSTSLRQGLPRNFLDYMGVIHDQPEDPAELKEMAKRKVEEQSPEDIAAQRKRDRMRALFRDDAKKRIMRVTKEAISMMDAACDQIGKRFLSDRLPPALTGSELQLTSEVNHVEGAKKVWPNTMCRLVRPGVARLILEEGKAVLYHCVDNSRVYHGNPLSPLEFEMDDAPALEALLTTVEPHWIMVKDLIHDDIEDKMEIAQALYDEGILAVVQTEKPDKSVQTG